MGSLLAAFSAVFTVYSDCLLALHQDQRAAAYLAASVMLEIGRVATATSWLQRSHAWLHKPGC